MEDRNELSAKDRKRLVKQRKIVAKQAQKFHREQEKRAKKSSVKTSGSKIKEIVNSRPKLKEENLSREEKYRRESEEKIRNLKPQDFDDGYYIDEYGERKRSERRAKEIHEQEKEVIRRRKKLLTSNQVKRRRILVYSAIFSVVLIIGVVLSLTVLFKTEKIVIEGDKYYSEEQIIAFSGVEKQENIFIAAMTNTAYKIKEKLPYIEEASVGFSIPDTVIIKITDAVPSYVIKNGSSYFLVSSKGRILEDSSQNTDKLPELKCDELKSTSIGDYVSFSNDKIPVILNEISESLRKNKVDKISGFDVTDTSNISLNYDNRITINLGLPADIDYKIRTAMAIINEKLDPNNTGTVTGILDVSACNTTKVSHYKPLETTQPPTTQPTTAVTDYSGNTYDDGSYTWDDGSNYDSGDSTWDDGSYYDSGENTWDDGSNYDSGDNTWDDGSNYDSDGNTWDSGSNYYDDGNTYDSYDVYMDNNYYGE